MLEAPATDDETLAIAETVGRWADQRIQPLALDRAHHIPVSLLHEMGEMGLFGLTLPESHGGSGLGLAAAAAVIERLARKDRSVATTLGLHLGLGTRGLVRWGSEAQLERWIPTLSTGQTIAAFATTEPESGSDLSALRTTIGPHDDGLSVRGNKIFVTNGALATLYTVSGRSPELGSARRGQSLVLLSRDDAGLVIGAEEVKLGLRASSTTTLDLDDMVVPMDRLLGTPGTGADMLRHILSWGRTVMAAGCVGTAAAALSATRAHTETRVQFGKPLVRLAVVREQLADMAAITFAAGALVHDAAADEVGLEISSLSAKVFASEAAGEVCDLALQLHGGYGFIEETGIALLVRDTRITRIFEGANDVLRIHRGLFAAVTESAASAPPAAAPTDAWARAARVRMAASRATRQAKERLGLRLGGDHRVLHALGARAILADTTDSAMRRATRDGTPAAAALAARWTDIALSRISAIDSREPDTSQSEHCLEWAP